MPGVYPVAGGIVTPVGFEVPPGAEIGSETHILNDHTYCCQMSGHECPSGEPKMEDSAICQDFHWRRLH